MDETIHLHDLPIRKDIPLASYTTLGIGGKAQFFAQPCCLEELLACLEWQRKHDLRLWVIGGGSNLVISDQGLSGMVLQYCEKKKKVIVEDEQETLIEVGAGHDWDEWVAWCVQEGLAGLECLSGIPGLVGASPVQNIGAYGQELCETFVSASVLDLETLVVEEWDAQKCAFGYRQSAFKQAAPNRWLVLSVRFRLAKDGKPSLHYPELCNKVNQLTKGKELSLKHVREAVLALRRSKSMVFDPKDPNSHSAGSFFVNPIMSKAEAKQVSLRLQERLEAGVTMPEYPVGERVKLSAAWLIQTCGLQKGCHWKEVGLSEKHTLALINRGSAKAEELMAFAQLVQHHVYEVSGVLLHPEPVFLGFEGRSLGAFPIVSLDSLVL